MTMAKVQFDEIPELRAYNNERDELRKRIIALKARRRVRLGDIISIVFENTDTVRWQICEMVRAERIQTDDGVAKEVEVYNDLVPDAGQLSATMFLELEGDAMLREWLPKLVGVHNAIVIDLPDGSLVRSYDPHEERLTREETTAAVHFVKFDFTDGQIAAFRAGPVRVRCDHPQYGQAVELSPEQHAAIAADFE